jgi:hypothetical protein
MQYYLTLDNPEPGFDACFESSAFAYASKNLEAIEEELKIKSHFELFSYAPQDSLMPEGYEETEVPWFEAREGVDWLEKVIDHIRANPSSVPKAQRLAEDLTECQEVLRQAEKIGAKWHFEMDI